MPRPDLAAALDLAPHPEGGWYRRTWTSPATVTTPHGPRPSATAILYLLDGPGRWHRVRSTELWLWHSGSEAELVLGGDGNAPGAEQVLRLGPPPGTPYPQPRPAPGGAGAGPGSAATGACGAELSAQHAVPPGVWQRASPRGDAPVLVSCVVSPGFDFADFELR